MTINFDTTNGLPYEFIYEIKLEMTPPDGRVKTKFATRSAMKASDGTTQLLAGTPQMHSTEVLPQNITDSFPIYNPSTGEDTGQTATFMQLWGLMYSALHHTRVQEIEKAQIALEEQLNEEVIVEGSSTEDPLT